MLFLQPGLDMGFVLCSLASEEEEREEADCKYGGRAEYESRECEGECQYSARAVQGALAVCAERDMDRDGAADQRGHRERGHSLYALRTRCCRGAGRNQLSAVYETRAQEQAGQDGKHRLKLDCRIAL